MRHRESDQCHLITTMKEFLMPELMILYKGMWELEKYTKIETRNKMFSLKSVTVLIIKRKSIDE